MYSVKDNQEQQIERKIENSDSAMCIVKLDCTIKKLIRCGGFKCDHGN